MKLFDRLFREFHGTVRYKLLALVLFPIVVFMPAVLVLSIYWGTRFAYDQFYIKVNTDLAVAHDIFHRIRTDYLRHLGQLGESYPFRVALDKEDSISIQEQLAAYKRKYNFTYLHLVDLGGYYLYEGTRSVHTRSSSSLLTAAQGNPVANIEIFSAADLNNEDSFLASRNSLSLIATPKAEPTTRKEEDRGMMMRAIYPVKSVDGKVIALLDGGVLLNRNFGFVDSIRDLVYGPGSLEQGSIGTVTVFLDDVRITTNVPLRANERALGTRVSRVVRNKVLREGQKWIDRAFVVNDWYISAYEPIMNENGERVGMLYSGYLEAPYRYLLWQAIAVLTAVFLLLMALSAWLAVKGAKTIFKPIEAMSDVVHATRAGEDRRIGQVDSRDEIGELAREFDVMLDLLQQRNQEISDWADQLEQKVHDRTEELEDKNRDLRSTIRLLRDTRQKLVVAEKLAALGEFTAGVAHEINNPIQVMLGTLDLLLSEPDGVDDAMREEIDIVIQQVYRVQDIIQNLLQYARPSDYAGYVSTVNVNDVVRDTFKLVQHLRKSKIFFIEHDLQASAKIQINLHELQQVLVNLIVNAVHAVADNEGEIIVSTHDWPGKGVLLRVRDNGVGIAEAELGKIFNPFYSSREQGQGNGLGLSISYGLIRRYGGNITVTSKPGVGTEFIVWLLSEPEMVEDEQTILEQLEAIETMQRTAMPAQSDKEL